MKILIARILFLLMAFGLGVCIGYFVTHMVATDLGIFLFSISPMCLIGAGVFVCDTLHKSGDFK